MSSKCLGLHENDGEVSIGVDEVMEEKEPIEVFFSYAHEDEELRDELADHLSNLVRLGYISSWHDRQIPAGDEWADEIDEHLNTAQIILLLVSSDFMASDYCYGIEMKRALERHQAGEARVIPIILRPVDWEGAPFAKLQALPQDAKPITSWANQDEAFTKVVRAIRSEIEGLEPPKPGSELEEKLSDLRSRMLVANSVQELKRIQYELAEILVRFPYNPDVLALEDSLEKSIAYYSAPAYAPVQKATYYERTKEFVRHYAGVIGMVLIIIVIGLVLQNRINAVFETIVAAFPFSRTSTATYPVVAEPPTHTATPSATFTFTISPSPTRTPTSSRTPTPTLTPAPLACGHIKIPSYVFPSLIDAGFEYAFWGYSDDSQGVFKCEGVYDKKHNTDVAIKLEYNARQDSDEYGYFGISTRAKGGVNISTFSKVCFWAYAIQPDQSFWLKIKDVKNKEGNVAVSVEDINDWSLICVDLSKYSDQNVDNSKLENISLGFDKVTGSATVWVDDFELR